LEAARFSNGVKIDYAYDAAGNRLGKEVSSRVTLTNLPERAVVAANQGTIGKPVFAFRATVSEDEETSFTQLRLRQATSQAGMAAFTQVRLIEDTNGNGIQDGIEPVISIAASPPLGDGELAFVGFYRALAANTAMDYLVLVDIAPSAPVGQTVTLSLEDEAGATARFGGVESGANIYPLGSAFSGPVITILLDNTPPAFAGLNVIPATGHDAHLTWTSATDTALPITYRIWQSTNSSFVPSGPPDYTTTELEHFATNLTIGTTHYFIARAVDSVGNEDTNTIRRDFTPTDPDPPFFHGIMTATPLYDGSGTIRISWEPAADISPPITYNVYFDTNPLVVPAGAPNYTTPGDLQPTGMLTFDIPGLPLGVPHTFIVRAEDSLNQEDTNLVRRTATPTNTVDTTPPSFAGLVQAVSDPAGTGDILLSWNPATDSQGTTPISYVIFWSTTLGDPNFAEDKITTETVGTALMPVRIPGLTVGVPHYFAVRAQDAAGNRDANTVVVSVTPTLQLSPAILFAGLVDAVASEDGSGVVTLYWDSALSIHPPVSFEVFKGVPPQNVFTLPVFTTTTGFGMEVTGLPLDVAARIGVRARDAANQTDANIVMLDATPVDDVAPTFEGLAMATGAQAGLNATITLEWDAAEDFSGPITYRIYESTTPGTLPGPGTLVASVTTLTHQLINRVQGQDYYYIVRAEDAEGNVDDNLVEWGIKVAVYTGVKNWANYE